MAANNNVSSGYQTEELDCLTSEFYGLIIGKAYSTLNEIKAQSGADVIINRKGSGKSFLKGDLQQRGAAREMILEKISASTRFKKRGDGFGEGWLELDFVSRDLIGLFGKRGETIKRLENNLNVKLKVNRDRTKLFIQDNPKTHPEIEQVIEELAQSVWLIQMKNSHPNCRRFLCITGNPESILTVQSPHDSTLSCLRNHPSLVDENDTTRQQADHLLKAFQITKEEQKKMVKTESSGEYPGPYANYLVHAGKMVSMKPPGTYPSRSESFQRALVYQRFTPADLDIVKIQSLPKINEYSRYDLTIITPKPFHRIRYKIFLARKEEDGGGSLCFITNEEAGVNENEFRRIREGPGYFSTSDVKTAAIDLIDPENGMTTRVNTFIYVDSKSDEENLKHHLKTLAPFFNGITIRQNGQDDSNLNDDGVEEGSAIVEAHRYQEISIPELPPGFGLKYFRRATRAAYRFAGRNILRTSKETVFIQEDTLFNRNQSDVVDLFFENQAIDDVLKGRDWKPSHVVDEIEKLLKFSNTMLAYCLK